MAVCDRITVLRDGKLPYSQEVRHHPGGAGKNDGGRETFGVQLQKACETSEPVYELSGISLEGKHGKKVWMTLALCRKR